MKSFKHFSTVMLAMGVTGSAIAAHASLAKPSDAHVVFTGSAAGLKFEGKTSDLDVAEAGGNVVISVPLKNLQTGVELRDKHMKEKYLEIDKFPSAKLTVARALLKFPAPGESTSADVTGTLELHGQAKPVSVHYDLKADGSTFVADGKVRINMQEVGIPVPEYSLIKVKSDVDVAVHFRVAGS
ncbi:MAG TPA: YceI family protein [Polyangiaceae bacterium]|nr:YceI family protein [Polyangiaceae bacterium]